MTRFCRAGTRPARGPQGPADAEGSPQRPWDGPPAPAFSHFYGARNPDGLVPCPVPLDPAVQWGRRRGALGGTPPVWSHPRGQRGPKAPRVGGGGVRVGPGLAAGAPHGITPFPDGQPRRLSLWSDCPPPMAAQRQEGAPVDRRANKLGARDRSASQRGGGPGNLVRKNLFQGEERRRLRMLK